LEIVINGETKEFEDNLSVEEVLKLLNLHHQRLAVELNLRVIRKDNWKTTTLKDADKLEIIHFVGGG